MRWHQGSLILLGRYPWQAFFCFVLFACFLGNFHYLTILTKFDYFIGNFDRVWTLMRVPVRHCMHTASQKLSLLHCVSGSMLRPKLGGSSLVHVLLVPFPVHIADSLNRLYNMLCKQIVKMIFVLKH